MKKKIFIWILSIILTIFLICAILILIGYESTKNQIVKTNIKSVTDLRSIGAIPAYQGQSVPKVIIVSDKNKIDNNGCYISPDNGPEVYIKKINLNNLNYCVSSVSMGPNALGLTYQDLYYTTSYGKNYVVVDFSIEHVDYCSGPTQTNCYSEKAGESFFENLVSTLSISGTPINNSVSSVAQPSFSPTAPKTQTSTTVVSPNLSKTYTNTKYNFQISYPDDFGAYTPIVFGYTPKQDSGNCRENCFAIAANDFDPIAAEHAYEPGSEVSIYIQKASDVLKYENTNKSGANVVIYISKPATESVNTLDKIYAENIKYEKINNDTSTSIKRVTINNQSALLFEASDSSAIVLIKSGIEYRLHFSKSTVVNNTLVSLPNQDIANLEAIINSFRFTPN